MQAFGIVVAIVGGGVLCALAFRRAADRVRVPSPVVFLVAAAVASDLIDPLGSALSPREVGWIGSAALIVILFDGGVSLGWHRVRPVVGVVAALGVLETGVAAGVMALAAQWVVGLSWTASAVLGVALAPTDPAVVGDDDPGADVELDPIHPRRDGCLDSRDGVLGSERRGSPMANPQHRRGRYHVDLAPLGAVSSAGRAGDF